MDDPLNEEQAAIVENVEAFAKDHLAPYQARWEEAGTIPREFLLRAGELGLGSICVAETSGGAGLGRLEATLIIEALAKACPSVAAFVSIHNMCAWMIDRFGSENLKQELLPSVCRFEKIVSYCLTEPGSGSDAAALRTKAVRMEDHFVLNGTKSFISGGGFSDLYLVMVRTGSTGPQGISALIADSTSKGLSFGAQERKMGWKAQPTCEVRFDHCKIPATRLLGEEGSGFQYAMAGLDGGRLNIAAASLGGAQSAFDQALSYVRERQAFGQTLDQFQSIQFKLAEMELSLETARCFLRHAALRLDRQTSDAVKYCAMAKLYVTDAAFKVANDALQIHGGYGYLADFGIEKILRDLRVHQILEGTNEIMRLIIARDLLKNNRS